ncbi:hypothetical protein D0C16_10910 [Cellvibrio sp. KY-GH-1]|uniref:hypothetical protein n=1 Tax=Cellvibrio sp. KY-GH-1 TaxID=2303332 RepID=UPI0012447DF1|nr:hypothetical protein [Cellvibrio sp. KY-GH-1]QEY16444.1 hypothetical protein D0C16_10910 [Cellvibrio sp. KY-GH-1]
MKTKVIGIMAAAAFAFSAQSFADYNVTVDTSACSWSTTSSGVSGGAGVGTVYWYNASLVCPSGTLATKSWWTSTSGQSSCSINAVSPYKINGNCNSYSIYYTVVEVPPGPAGAACTWTTYPTGGAGMGNVRAEFYSPIGTCVDKTKVVEYRSNVYYSTYYLR